MTSPSSQPSSHGRENDRRRYHRFLAQTLDFVLHADGKTMRGKLVNESIGGLAILMRDAGGLVAGQAVQINLREAISTAYVRSIHRSLDGQYRVSISWEKNASREMNAVAGYVAHENLFLVCEVVRGQDRHVKVVRLWDGAEFEVFEEEIYERTYEERRDELNTVPTKLPVLVRLYGLKPHADTNKCVADILEFEFSSKFQTVGNES